MPDNFNINSMDNSNLIDLWNKVSYHLDDMEMEEDGELQKIREQASLMLDKVVKAYYLGS
jgi:hypothetical protein